MDGPGKVLQFQQGQLVQVQKILEQVMVGSQLQLGQLDVLQTLQRVNFWEVLEFGLELVVGGQLGEEGVVGVGGEADLLELAIHAEHDLFTLTTCHAIEVEVFVQDGLVLPLKERLGRHIYKRLAKALLSLLFRGLVAVMILFDRVG